MITLTRTKLAVLLNNADQTNSDVLTTDNAFQLKTSVTNKMTVKTVAMRTLVCYRRVNARMINLNVLLLEFVYQSLGSKRINAF
jgi:hypothetical protein